MEELCIAERVHDARVISSRWILRRFRRNNGPYCMRVFNESTHCELTCLSQVFGKARAGAYVAIPSERCSTDEHSGVPSSS